MSLQFLLLLATVSNVVLAVVAVAAAGLACVAYGVFIERQWYRVAAYRLEVLPEDAGGLTLLHLSDLHFVQSDPKKSAFLASLPQADVTVMTGDLIGEPSAVEGLVAAVRPVRGKVASYFVLGSNDYFAPSPRNYLAYFRRKRRHRLGTRGRSAELVDQLEAEGWRHLRNRKADVTIEGTHFEVMGLDDAHIERHDMRVAARRDPDKVGLAVTHSPDPAPELAALGYELILAGHTHGGQVRMPFVGALVTNGTTPTKLCMGLSRIGRSLMHVSPGIGTSKYAPFRFLCRPEATILHLVSVRTGGGARRAGAGAQGLGREASTARHASAAAPYAPERASS